MKNPSPDTRDYDEPFAMPWQPRTDPLVDLRRQIEALPDGHYIARARLLINSGALYMDDAEIEAATAHDRIVQPIIDRMYELMGKPVMWRNGDYFAVVHPNWWKRRGTRLRWDHQRSSWFIVEMP